MSSAPAIETFPNPRPGRDFEIAIDCPEFTSVCPKTGLPDFGVLSIRYMPSRRCQSRSDRIVRCRSALGSTPSGSSAPRASSWTR